MRIPSLLRYDNLSIFDKTCRDLGSGYFVLAANSLVTEMISAISRTYRLTNKS